MLAGKLRPRPEPAARKALQHAIAMNLRIERLVDEKDTVVFRASGRIDADHLDMLRGLLEQEKGKVAIDCREVTLVSREAIRFLAGSEAQGVELTNCANYIREWIARERRGKQRS